jgi:hypothetical protein
MTAGDTRFVGTLQNVGPTTSCVRAGSRDCDGIEIEVLTQGHIRTTYPVGRAMSALNDYVGRCRGTVIRWRDRLPTEAVSWPMHLIDHGEPAEAMNALAWLITESGRNIEDDEIDEIRELIGGLVPEESLPERFRVPS